MLQISKYCVAVSGVCHAVIRTHRREARRAVQKLIQFNRIDMRFSGCGKTLKENCLISLAAPALMLFHVVDEEESPLIYNNAFLEQETRDAKAECSEDILMWNSFQFQREKWCRQSAGDCRKNVN